MKETLFRRSMRPIQLTSGPISYEGASVSRDGKHVFAIGTTQRGELVRYDMKSHEFVPFLSGISAVEPSFSRDGQWVAYESFPDENLWRSRSDGSDKMQLTYPPIKVGVPHTFSRMEAEWRSRLQPQTRSWWSIWTGGGPPGRSQKGIS